ncbi:hypothetical protein [Spirosoma flavum]|uniref:Uncharacterized protein n=1 Tax=Spirosoma flavum TaxID=2048557 RepID=A0ABW6ANN3_9BACT
MSQENKTKRPSITEPSQEDVKSISSMKPASREIYTDLFIKMAPIFISIIGFFWGIYQFNAQQENNAKSEFDRRMFEKTLETYADISKVVGKMTTLQLPRDSLIFDTLQKDFNERYWGVMLLVQQDPVRQALRELKGEIKDANEVKDVESGRQEISNLILRQDHLSQKLREALQAYRSSK